jgi:hypothetical protein
VKVTRAAGMMLIRNNAQVRGGGKDKPPERDKPDCWGAASLKRASPAGRKAGRGRGLLCETASRGNRVGRVEEGKGSKWRKCTSPDKSRLGPIHTRIYSGPSRRGFKLHRIETRVPHGEGMRMRENGKGNGRWVKKEAQFKPNEGRSIGYRV